MLTWTAGFRSGGRDKMRKLYRRQNPSDGIDLNTVLRLITELPSPEDIIHTKWPLDDRSLRPLFHRITQSLPPGWTVCWAKTSSTKPLSGRHGITFDLEGVIVITEDNDEDALYTFLHESYHAREVAAHKWMYQKPIHRLIVELNAELFAMSFLYNEPDSPWYKDIHGLLEQYVYTLLGHGLGIFTETVRKENLTRSLMFENLPDKWMFLVPYINDAMKVSYKQWVRTVNDTPYKQMPPMVLRAYAELIQRGGR